MRDASLFERERFIKLLVVATGGKAFREFNLRLLFRIIILFGYDI